MVEKLMTMSSKALGRRIIEGQPLRLRLRQMRQGIPLPRRWAIHLGPVEISVGRLQNEIYRKLVKLSLVCLVFGIGLIRGLTGE